MDTLIRILLTLALLLPTFGAHAAEDGRDYRLAAGDRISIAVFGEPDLSVDARVGDNGRIAYPFVGELRLGGLTVAEVERQIHEALAGDFLVDPKVSVSVVEYRPFFVNGQVRSPGSFAWQPGMTVRKAVSLAGGFTERASERGITVIAEGQADRSKGRPVGLEDRIAPGDILTVDESFF